MWPWLVALLSACVSIAAALLPQLSAGVAGYVAAALLLGVAVWLQAPAPVLVGCVVLTAVSAHANA